MQVRSSKYLLALLAIACAGALPIRASATVSEPTITLKVNGVDTAFQGAPQFDPDAGFWSSDLVASGNGWSLSGQIFFGEFPGDTAFIDYALNATSSGEGPSGFSLNLSFPFVAGPYGILQTHYGSAIKDGFPFNGSAEAGINALPFIHNALLANNIVPGSELSTGCSLKGNAGFYGVCPPGVVALTIPVSTQSHGMLGIAVSFNVSPHDTFYPGGGVALTGVVVPEPGTQFALLAGLLGILGAIARRRIR